MRKHHGKHFRFFLLLLFMMLPLISSNIVVGSSNMIGNKISLVSEENGSQIQDMNIMTIPRQDYKVASILPNLGVEVVDIPDNDYFVIFNSRSAMKIFLSRYSISSSSSSKLLIFNDGVRLELHLKHGFVRIFGSTSEKIKEFIQGIKNIISVIVPNIKFKVNLAPLQDSTETSGYTLSETAKMLGIDKLHDDGVLGKNVTVAIIDSGINDDIPALATLYSSNEKKVIEVRSFVDTDDDGYPDTTADDPIGHGTHVATIIAGNGKFYRKGSVVQTDNLGMAPDAYIASYRIIADNYLGELDWIINALEHAIEQDVDVINMSIGSQYFNITEDPVSILVKNATKVGILLVAAAGNYGPNEYSSGFDTGGATITTPGIYPEVIAVGAIETPDSYPSFTSRGPGLNGISKPDVVAPGVKIVSASKDGSEVAMSGTSMAAPHVAGGLALLKQLHGNVSSWNYRVAVMKSSKDLGFPVNVQGRGLVNFTLAHDLMNDQVALSAAPSRYSDENLVLDARLMDKTYEFNLSLYSTKNMSISLQVESIINKTDATGTEKYPWDLSDWITFPDVLDVKEGLNIIPLTFKVAPTNPVGFYAARIKVFETTSSSNASEAQDSIFLNFFLKPPRGKILLDSSKDHDINGYFASDTLQGYDLFQDVIESLGFIIEENKNGNITSELLDEYHVLVISDPDKDYSLDELDAIDNFITQKNGSLLVAGMAPVYNSTDDLIFGSKLDNINNFLKDFGVEIDATNGSIYASANGAPFLINDLNRDHPIFKGINIIPYFGSAINIREDALGSLARFDTAQGTKTAVAEATTGSDGKIIVIGTNFLFKDQAILLNEIYGEQEKDLSYNATRFFLQLFDYLISQKKITYTIENIQNNMFSSHDVEIKYTFKDPEGNVLTGKSYLNGTLYNGKEYIPLSFKLEGEKYVVITSVYTSELFGDTFRMWVYFQVDSYAPTNGEFSFYVYPSINQIIWTILFAGTVALTFGFLSLVYKRGNVHKTKRYQLTPYTKPATLSLDKYCPSCGKMYPFNMFFCVTCGTPLALTSSLKIPVKFCPRCKILHFQKDASFCRECGRPLKGFNDSSS